MFSLLRLIIKIAFFLLLLLLVGAYFTNPSLENFKAEVRTQVKSQLDKLSDDPTLSIIASLGADFSDDMVDKLITRKEYYICSVYVIELPTGNYEYLGAFKIFYPLQDENPMEKFINTFQGLH